MVNKKETGDPVLGETFSTPFKTNSLHFSSRSGTEEQGLLRLIERFSYDLEMKTREQNRNNNGNRAI